MRSALGLVLVGLVACGSDGISIEDAPDAFLDEACNYLARCHLVTNHAACLELNLGLELRIDASLAAAIEAGKVKYDGTKLAQCYATFGDRSCDRTTEDGRGLGLNGDACDGAITGTVADGGACAIDEECLSRSCTVPTCPDACCQGTCDPSVASTGPAPLGGACETTSDCASGGYCATGVCTALLAAGATCAGTTECAYGLGCAGTPRTCKQLPTVGQACPDGQCRDAGTYCDQSMVCKAVGLLGDACATAQDCVSYYTCDATMHCALGPHEGQACGTGARCADAGNFCQTSTMTCVAPQPIGATCAANSQCASHYCGSTGITRTCEAEPVCY